MEKKTAIKNRFLLFAYLLLIVMYITPYITGQLNHFVWRGVPVLLLWMMGFSMSFVVLTIIGYFQVFAPWSLEFEREKQAEHQKEEI